MTRHVVITLALAGCNQIFGISAASPLPDAPASIDAPPCAVPVFTDSFDVGPPCSSWAFPDMTTATVSVANGQLVIAPEPDMGVTRGGCISQATMPFGESGAFFQVTSTVGDGEYKFADVDFDHYTTTITWGGSLTFTRADNNDLTAPPIMIAATTFDAQRTSWARVRPSSDRSQMIAEIASDGSTWVQLGIDDFAAPQMVGIQILGGTFQSEDVPTPITFDGFDVCPS